MSKLASQEVFAACGCPPTVAGLSTSGAAQAAREDYRRFVQLAVAPLARQVAGELSAKLEAPIRFDFADLHAFDIQGRAAAFAKMVQGSMDVERAFALSGLMAADAA